MFSKITSILTFGIVMSATTAFAQSEYGGTSTTLIRVQSQPTTVRASASAKGFNRVNKAIEKAVSAARTKIGKQCKTQHQSDAQCNKVCKAKDFDKGRATIKGLEFRRVCEFGESKTKIVKRCRTKRKNHRESVEARGQCACACSKYHRNINK